MKGDGSTTCAQLRDDLRTLVSPGCIADYDHIELTEVFATPRGAGPLNVLTIAVLGEGRPEVGAAQPTEILTRRIPIEGFKNWSFGVARTIRPVTALDQALEAMTTTGQWALSGQPIATGALQPDAVMFVPPDGTATVPLNAVLKNNFWAGSHVARLVDRDKAAFAPFFADRRRLQALSDAISSVVPIALSGLADLLGDVLIQLPVTLFFPTSQRKAGVDHEEVSLTWRQGAAPRMLRIAARTRWDEVLTGAAVTEAVTTGAPHETFQMAISAGSQPLEMEIWDAQLDLLLGATVATSTITQINLHMRLMQPEPRLFSAPDADGHPMSERLSLYATDDSIVGELRGHDRHYWRTRRQELEEKQRLEETRDFVQYRPQPGSNAERSRALDDIRFLISRHGEAGVDLWDPYLTAADILQTLFWCPAVAAPLRALTDGRDPPIERLEDGTKPTLPPFVDRQRDRLAGDSGNCEGLRLEYRTRRGQNGWPFHDRFLIFPNGESGPLAWSLGTSINSLGQAHHILQRVSNPALVAGAFDDLWSALNESQHRIWRSW